MNDGRDVLPSLGASHAEPLANAEGMTNTSTMRAAGEPAAVNQIQVPRSPQLLSLQVDGLNAGIYDKIEHGASYVETSERGSDTSADGRPPEPRSASTFTGSLPSLPASLSNDYDRATELDGSNSFVENSQSSRTEPILENSQDSLHTLSVNGDGVDELRPLKSERSSNGSLSPVRSSQDHAPRSGVDTQFAPRHKRTATGDIKPLFAQLVTPHSDDVNGASRRRSKSTGSPAHGNRIAQLSVHIRTRLSYAAAKIEKSRQSQANSQLAPCGLDGLSSLVSQTTSSSASPLNSNSTSHPPHSSNSSTPRPLLTHHRSQSALSSPGKLLAIPKLAPPVDIVSSNGDTRRRPNPNEPLQKLDGRSPYARHKRHHSTQELPVYNTMNGSPRVFGPGTPSIPLLPHAPTSSQGGFYGSRTQSQNTSMEQDAIETLLFMSSPENSGYRSSPRPLQPLATQRSLNESIYSNQNGVGSHHSQASRSNESQDNGNTKHRTLGLGLEANAGDEIDRILDQMESDSEDDARYTSHRLLANTQFRGHQGRPG